MSPTGRPSMFLRILAAFFSLLTIFFVYKIGQNLWDYARMRSAPIEVVNSSLLADATSDKDLFFVLRLDLHATDGSDRRLHWEEEIVPASYLEEAYDELRKWAPGTKHTVQFLRGQARELRLSDSTENPELHAAAGWTFGAGFGLAIAISFLVVVSAEDSILRRWGLHKFFGPWIAFAMFGLFPLIGGIAWGIVEAPKRFQWITVTGTIVQPASLPAPPANVQITPAASAVLAEKKARSFLRYTWNGRTLYGGIGGANGRYDSLFSICSESSETCQFAADPKDRWEFAPKMAFDGDFWGPFLTLMFFGIAFTGAGLFIRKLQWN